ncbi:response regulator transcription factor [Cedecea neteri]|uniref:response regulator transcription factor n=1 Tax=Cedecea neteri TaxID=158822 RepID=UPI0004F6E24A|nr:response regulator transcription factor [Cedecea neteri]AIR65536.1 hypothetical protein LH86_10660 [Cedecea neteri]
MKRSALIVDDHPSIRLALGITLGQLGFDDIDECDSGIDAIHYIKNKSYRIVILDLGILNIDGMTVIDTVRKLEIRTKFLVYTALASDVYAQRSFRAGACGFVSKSDSMDSVATAVKAIDAGYSFFPKMVIHTSPQRHPFETLSNRELAVLRKITLGLSNNEIAENMCLSNKTVSTYKTRIMKKLGVSNLVELIAVANCEKVN